MDNLLRVLSAEIVVHTDGGQRAVLARHPIYGPERVARYLSGLQHKYFSLPGLLSQFVWISPG
ncbi:hypothetical protein EPA93_00465 [Ktedonosporobacter rubrisoli]|uniref:Uncharacterized protein n=1 Tax=Ktedonosporobacter rubrisoli TaxID=2509675 RepID=A0A4P6JHP2_KTERU|nr:hypothetical protein [Ktedonosporobacter rubrisoli]QBD74544.1 hypothetical protein EPA93_00465 [Ktedonosporobacter rubrisoli]